MNAFQTLTTGIRVKAPKRLTKLFKPEATSSSSHAFDELAPELDFFKPAARPTKIQKIDQATEADDAHLDPQQAAELQKHHRIKVTGSIPPRPMTSFTDLSPLLPNELSANIQRMNFATPTPVQLQCIPIMLENRDLLACAPTGSGKTLAFLLPIVISHFRSKSRPHIYKGPRAIVIEPTREMSRQILTEVKKLTQGTDYRAMVLGSEEDDIGRKPDLIITTPLRLVHALKAKSVFLDNLQTFVMDEADKLFERDFIAQTDEILEALLPFKVQKALLSATLPSSVEEMAATVMGSSLLRVIVGQKDSATDSIEQELLFVGNEDGKISSLQSLISSGGFTPPVIIFVQAVQRAKELFNQIALQGLRVEVLHSDRTKAERDDIVARFAGGEIWLLIATDVMSRGVDYRGVNLVINYDFPQSTHSYIHRIGRTGRAGRPGKAITLFTADDGPYLKSIVNVMRSSGCEVPEWMLKLKKPSKNVKRQLKHRPIAREDVKSAAMGMGQMASPKKQRRRRTDQAPVENQIGGGEAEDSNDSEVWGGIGD